MLLPLAFVNLSKGVTQYVVTISYTTHLFVLEKGGSCGLLSLDFVFVYMYYILA